MNKDKIFDTSPASIELSFKEDKYYFPISSIPRYYTMKIIEDKTKADNKYLYNRTEKIYTVGFCFGVWEKGNEKIIKELTNAIDNKYSYEAPIITIRYENGEQTTIIVNNLTDGIKKKNEHWTINGWEVHCFTFPSREDE